ncbi:hypothetical protein AN963_09555 [Brevibacillus choshinensis]|uniref:Uncharacterized protein n=1 Tax=Brevibacillus choshinensis TaxID=54911 RepID=A0ABR5NED7_BRECH|nr:hypothetical protein [Brevibacillus choshinensis]KQL49912.1 hypothetical protein AN963_09555 [Brevibacillus choshinensis]
MLYRLCLVLFLIGFMALPASAATDIGSVRINPTPVASWQDLVKRSELIVFAWIDSASQSVPTGRSLREGKLVNYVQTAHVKQVLKGSSHRMLKLVSTGVEPLPDASSPLNRTYPGPLAEGNYVLFLHPVSATDLYSAAGLWQGVYPLYQGQTIALEGAGFSDLNQLTVEQLARKIKSISP